MPRDAPTLRDLMDSEFKQVHKELRELKDEVVENRRHTHPQYVLWAALLPLLITGTWLLINII